MKRILFFAITLIAPFVFASCDSISGVDLTDTKSVNKMLPAAIEKHMDPETRITEIAFMSSGDFVKRMEIAVIKYLDESTEKPMSITIPLAGNQKPRDPKEIKSTVGRKSEENNGVKLRDIDFSGIAGNIDVALEAMNEEGIQFDGIDSYYMYINSDPAKTRHNFTLESKAGSDLGTRHGRLVVETSYYKFEFEVDADGIVSFKED